MSSRIVSIAVFVFAFAFSVHAAGAGKWVSSKSGSGRSLTYSGTATVMGKPTPITLKFYCDTTYSASEKGAIGFELTFAHVAALAPFGFDNFEGPDAPAFSKELLMLVIARKGKPPLTFKLAPNGSYPEEGSFSFGAAEVTHEPVSTPKSIIRALSDGAESLRITITDFRNPKLKLDVTIPVAGQETAFKSLLTGVK